MLGWSITARACRSASKRASTDARVHAGLDELQGHLAPHRLRLLGHPDCAHASLADRFQQLVAAGDDGAGLLAGSVGHGLLRGASPSCRRSA